MKFPYLIESRYFFFGLLEVRQWGWRCGLTRPQIDLLLHDQPVIDYHSKDKKKGNTGVQGKNVREAAERALAQVAAARESGEDKLDNLNIEGVTIKL